MTLLYESRLPRSVDHDDLGGPNISDVSCELNVGSRRIARSIDDTEFRQRRWCEFMVGAISL
jgi:hypothetical protein